MAKDDPSYVKNMNHDEVLVKMTLDDDPRSKRARVFDSEGNEHSIPREDIVFVKGDFR